MKLKKDDRKTKTGENADCSLPVTKEKDSNYRLCPPENAD
jgi:hypothetical protein